MKLDQLQYPAIEEHMFVPSKKRKCGGLQACNWYVWSSMSTGLVFEIVLIIICDGEVPVTAQHLPLMANVNLSEAFLEGTHRE